MKDLKNNFLNIDNTSYKNMNIINYILKSKNQLIYDSIMKNYKEKIEFINADSYYAFLIELLNQKKIEDFIYFIELESDFSKEVVSFQKINKQLTKNKLPFIDSSVGYIKNHMISQSLLLENSKIYNLLLSLCLYDEKKAIDNYKIKKWFLDIEILKKTPIFILENINYYKSYKDKEVYLIIDKINKNFSNEYFYLDNFVINNMSEKENIIKDFKTLIDLDYDSYEIESYFKNNILYYQGIQPFTIEDYKKISSIVKKYSEKAINPVNTLQRFGDFFFKYNYKKDTSHIDSINYTKEVPYRYKANQELYDMITKSLTLEQKQDIAIFFLNGIFKINNYKIDFINNLSTIENIYKKHGFILSKPEYLLKLNDNLLNNSFDIKINIYIYTNSEVYEKLHIKSRQEEISLLSNHHNNISNFLKKCSYYSAKNEEMENTILNIDKDHLSIFRELLLIKIKIENNKSETLYEKIESKLDSFLKKTNMTSKKLLFDFFNEIKNSNEIDTPVLFSYLFEKMYIKNICKNLNINNIKKRI